MIIDASSIGVENVMCRARGRVLRAWLSIPAAMWMLMGEADVGRAAPPRSTSEIDELKEQYDRLEEQAKYEDATSLAKRACELAEKTLGPRSERLADCLSDLGDLHHLQGQYEDARRQIERVVAIRKRSSGSSSPAVASAMTDLAVVLLNQGKFREAQASLESALAVRGRSAPEEARSISTLATLYEIQGRYEESEASYVRAITILEEALGPDHLDVAQSLNNFGLLLQLRGRHEEATSCFERALEITESTLGANHPQMTSSLNNLALVYRSQGRYDEAKRLFERALEILEATHGTNHHKLALGLHNLALVLQDEARYEEACSMFERALEIYEGSLGPDHPELAHCLHSLAMIHRKWGDHATARQLLARALLISERRLGSRHPLVAKIIESQASFVGKDGDFARAEAMYEAVLSTREEVLGIDHIETAGCLINLAMLEARYQRYEAARSHYERALTILEQKLGREHPAIATALGNLAWVHNELGQRQEAGRLLEEALTIRERVLGPRHPDVALNLWNLGAHHEDHGRHDLAAEYVGRGLLIEQAFLNDSLLFAEEHRRMSQASTVHGPISGTISLHLQAAPTYRPSAELALTTLLRRKGLMLDLGARSTAAVRRTLPEEHQHLLDDLSATRDRLAALTNHGPGRLPIERYAEQLAATQREQRRLWREIASHSPIVDALFDPITISDVQAALPSDGVLVEYVRYFPSFHEKSPSTPPSPRYAAYLVFPDRFDWVDLGLAETIDAQTAAFRRDLVLRSPIPSTMYDRVMSPVLDRLGDAEVLFIAPDASLNLVPFAALFDGERYVVERHQVHVLATGRDLVHPWSTGVTSEDTVVVVANPTGADLGGADLEADRLRELFPHAKVLQHDEATELEAQRHARPWLLHVAGHGFFDSPKPDPTLESAMSTYEWWRSPGSLPVTMERKDGPMMHAGLLLAPGSNDEEVEASFSDGRLTAYEISGWDLRGTELVVLSACGTGLGKVENGEGVLGLRRGFAIAGAETQVMSLWDVSDATTATLMDAYYRKLIAGKGRGEAMREVQLEMLRSPEHRHPRDWASFVVVGEWGPLSAERLPKPEGPEPIPARSRGGCTAAEPYEHEHPRILLCLGLLGLLARRRRGQAG